MCVFADVPHHGWGTIVTQIDEWDDKKAIENHEHELLICTSDTFKGSLLTGRSLKRKCILWYKACERLDYVLMRPQGFKLFVDQRNLINIFAPDESLKEHTNGKLLRWASKIAPLRYTIESLDDERNLWADMLSRWGGRTAQAHHRIQRTRKLHGVGPHHSRLRPMNDSFH